MILKSKLKKYYNKINKILGMIRREVFLKEKKFTIISNNCWGGIVYKYYDLEYLSPTIGVFFFAEDYIKFLKNLKNYLEKELNFIEMHESNYFQELKRQKINEDVIIAQIEDIEIIFLHYSTKEEALEKWKRRKERIQWDKLIIKFNDQNLCNYELIKKFDDLEFKNKLCFTSKDYKEIKSSVFLKKYYREKYVLNDTKIKNYKKYINVTDLINNLKV